MAEHHYHEHHHHHHGPQVADASLKNVYILSIVLNLTYVVVEAVAGLYYHSVGLLSDAGHNLSDIISLALALVALGLLHSHQRKGYTYGYRKMSVLISLTNAVLLLLAVGAIIVESVGKLLHPVEVNGAVISWTAGAGILVNGLTTLLLLRKRSHDLNTQGAFLHMLADTLVSVGVVVSGIVIHFTGWFVIDPIIGLVIAVVILAGTWDLLKQSIRLSIDAIPEGVHMDSILEQIQALEGIKEVHHIHVWPISTTETALTAHLVVENLSDAESIVHAAKEILSREGIAHSTLEVETAGHCSDASACC
ncbi:MAG: cation transporter [Bacteroidales bacterium]|nr:cation transporter [Bacteroidales bacterium]